MCFGGQQPSAPEIKYVGPSDDEINANKQALADYQAQMAAQQSQFQTQLQSQIDAANAETAALQEQYAADLEAAKGSAASATSAAKESAASSIAEAGAMANMQQIGAYKVGASESEPVNAQTTTAAKPKEKPKNSLKIASGSMASTAGTGLNIGV